jgi:uncharacterized protein (TIGR02145 family)
MGKDSNNEKSIIKANQSELVRVSKSISITNKILKESKTKISELLYQTININGLEWMVENLNVKSFRNGEPIREAKSAKEWIYCFDNKIPAWCYYNNDHNNDNLGLLYNHFAFLNIENIAPDSYRIPSRDEWWGLRKELIKYMELYSYEESTNERILQIKRIESKFNSNIEVDETEAAIYDCFDLTTLKTILLEIKNLLTSNNMNLYRQFNYRLSGLRHGLKDCEFYAIDSLTAHYENRGTPFYLHQKSFSGNGNQIWRINSGYEHGWYIRLIKDK